MWIRYHLVISFLALLKTVYINSQDEDVNEITILLDDVNAIAISTNETIETIRSTKKFKTVKVHAAINETKPYYSEELEIIEIKGKLKSDSRFLTETSVITCDGYILSLFRVNNNNSEKYIDKYPVLMFHGLMQSSDVFTEGGNNAIAFIINDLGFDVWLGNSRGNKYGRRQVNLEPDMYEEKYQFFNYTYEEIGIYDVAANVDYILKETGKSKVHYIAHGQGGTAFLVLNSLHPHYNVRFESAHLLAPLGYQRHTNAEIKALSDKSTAVYKNLLRSGIVEIFPYDPTTSISYESPSHCFGGNMYEKECNDLNIIGIMGLDPTKQLNLTRGGAVKQLEHYAQNVRDKAFRRWDYGVEGNIIAYGSIVPPEYNLKLVTAKTVLHYSVHDSFVAGEDIVAMAKDMPPGGRAVEVNNTNFTHSDFINGKDLIPCVYREIVRDMSNGKDYLKDWKKDEGYKPASASKLTFNLILYVLPLLTLQLS